MSTKYVCSIKCTNNYLLPKKKPFRKMNWQEVLIAPLVTSLLSISTAIVTSNQVLSMEVNPTISKVEISKELKAVLAKQGIVRVIVGLNVDFKPEGELATPQEVAEQQSKIAEAQTQLISQIRDIFVLEEKLFSTIPYISINANQAILDILTDNPLVKTIQLDETTSLSFPSNDMEVIQ